MNQRKIIHISKTVKKGEELKIGNNYKFRETLESIGQIKEIDYFPPHKFVGKENEYVESRLYLHQDGITVQLKSIVKNIYSEEEEDEIIGKSMDEILYIDGEEKPVQRLENILKSKLPKKEEEPYYFEDDFNSLEYEKELEHR